MRTPRITRRRVAAWALAIATTAFLTVLVVQSSGSSAARPDVLAQQAIDSAPMAVEPDPVPTERPTASPTASLSAVQASPIRTPILAAIDDSGMVLPNSCGGPDNLESCADGQPGWYSGFTSCTVPTTVDASGEAPLDGMTLALTMPQGQITAGQTLTGTLTATNPTEYRVSFTIGYLPWGDSELSATVLGPGGGGAIYTSDVLVSESIVLEAGASVDRKVSIPTATCGDTRSDPDVPLAAGPYAVTAAVSFSGTKVEPSAAPSTSPDGTTTGSPSQAPSPGASNQPSPTPHASESPAASASASPSPRPTAHNEGVWVAATSITIQ